MPSITYAIELDEGLPKGVALMSGDLEVVYECYVAKATQLDPAERDCKWYIDWEYSNAAPFDYDDNQIKSKEIVKQCQAAVDYLLGDDDNGPVELDCWIDYEERDL